MELWKQFYMAFNRGKDKEDVRYIYIYTLYIYIYTHTQLQYYILHVVICVQIIHMCTEYNII